MNATAPVSNIPLPKESLGEQLSLLDEQLDDVIQGAPVMIQVVDRHSGIVQVNERWIEEMGYDREDVLGRKWTEFLTGESRARIVARVIPHAIRAGSARSVGVDFVRRDNRVLQRLLDSELDAGVDGSGFRYGAIFDTKVHNQWAQAAITMSAVQELIRLRDGLRRGVMAPANMDLAAGAARLARAQRREIQVGNTHLTRKETEVLTRLATGATNGDIARHFSLSLNTVKFHVENIYQKLGVSNRTQAVRVARVQGLVED